MMELRNEITSKLDNMVLNKIKNSPKPTKVAEVIAVTKNFPGMAFGFDEIAELINISNPGASEKSRESDYDANEIKRHPDLLIVHTPDKTYVRFTGDSTAY